MPNAWRHFRRTATFTAGAPGPANYANAVPPQISMICKEIISINDVRMWADGGYWPMPLALVQTNNRFTFSYRVYTLNRLAAVGAVQDHSHPHDLLVVNNAGAAMNVNIAAAKFEAQTAGDVTVAGNQVGGGIRNSAATAHAAAAAALKSTAPLEEVQDGTNLGAITFNAMVTARMR